MTTAKLIIDGDTQIVLLPKAYRIKEKEVSISRIGDAIILLPKRKRWDSLFSSLDKFSDDFMQERNQLELENREDFSHIT